VVREVKKAKSVSASKVKTLKSSNTIVEKGIVKSQAVGKQVGRFSKKQASEDLVLKGMQKVKVGRTVKDRTAEKEFARLLKTRPKTNLPYKERVEAINAWIEKNRTILEDPRYAAESQKLVQSERKKLNRMSRGEARDVISKITSITVPVEKVDTSNAQVWAVSQGLNIIDKGTHKVVKIGSREILLDEYYKQKAKPFQSYSYEKYQEKVDDWLKQNEAILTRGKDNFALTTGAIKKIESNLKAKNLEEYNRAVSDFEQIGTYDERVEKLNMFIDENKNILGRGDNYDRSQSFLEAQQQKLKDYNLKRYNEVIKDLPTTGTYDERVEKLNTFIETKKDILGRGDNYEKAQEMLVAEQEKLKNLSKQEYEQAVSNLDFTGTYEERVRKLNKFIEGNKSILSRENNYDKAQDMLAVKESELDQLNLREYQAAKQDLEAKWKPGNYKSNEELLKTFVESNQSILGRGDNYELAKNLLENKQAQITSTQDKKYNEIISGFKLEGDSYFERAKDINEFITENKDILGLRYDDASTFLSNQEKLLKDFKTSRYNEALSKKPSARSKTYTTDIKNWLAEYEVMQLPEYRTKAQSIIDSGIKEFNLRQQKTPGGKTMWDLLNNDKYIKEYHADGSLKKAYLPDEKYYSQWIKDKGDRSWDKEKRKTYTPYYIEFYSSGKLRKEIAEDVQKDVDIRMPSGDRERGYDDYEVYDYRIKNGKLENRAKGKESVLTWEGLMEKGRQKELDYAKTYIDNAYKKGDKITATELAYLTREKETLKPDDYTSIINYAGDLNRTTTSREKVSDLLISAQSSGKEITAKDLLGAMGRDVSGLINNKNLIQQTTEFNTGIKEARKTYELEKINITDPGISIKEKAKLLEGDFGLSQTALNYISKQEDLTKQQVQDISSRYNIQEGQRALAKIDTELDLLSRNDLISTDTKMLEKAQQKALVRNMLVADLTSESNMFDKIQQDRAGKVDAWQVAESQAANLSRNIIDNKLSMEDATNLQVRTRLDLKNTRRDFAKDVDIYGEYFKDSTPIDYDSLSWWDKRKADYNTGNEMWGNFFNKRGLRKSTIKEKKQDFLSVKESGSFFKNDVLSYKEAAVLSDDAVPTLGGFFLKGFTKSAQGIGTGISWYGKGVSDLFEKKLTGKYEDGKLEKTGIFVGEVLQGYGDQIKYDPFKQGVQMALGAGLSGGTSMISSFAKSAKIGKKVLTVAKTSKKVASLQKTGKNIGLTANILGTSAYAGSTGISMVLAAPEDRAKILGAGLADFTSFEMGQRLGDGLLKVGQSSFKIGGKKNVYYPTISKRRITKFEDASKIKLPEDKIFGAKKLQVVDMPKRSLAGFDFKIKHKTIGGEIELKGLGIYDPELRAKKKFITKVMPKETGEAVLKEFRKKTVKVDGDYKLQEQVGFDGDLLQIRKIRDTNFNELAELSKYQAKDIGPKFRKTTRVELGINDIRDLTFEPNGEIKIPEDGRYKLKQPIDSIISGEPVKITDFEIIDKPNRNTLTKMRFENKVTGVKSSFEQDGNLIRGYQDKLTGKITKEPTITDMKKTKKVVFASKADSLVGTILEPNPRLDAMSPKNIQQKQLASMWVVSADPKMLKLGKYDPLTSYQSFPKKVTLNKMPDAIGSDIIKDPRIYEGRGLDNKKVTGLYDDLVKSNKNTRYDAIGFREPPKTVDVTTQKEFSMFNDDNIKTIKGIKSGDSLKVFEEVKITTKSEVEFPSSTKIQLEQGVFTPEKQKQISKTITVSKDKIPIPQTDYSVIITKTYDTPIIGKEQGKSSMWEELSFSKELSTDISQQKVAKMSTKTRTQGIFGEFSGRDISQSSMVAFSKTSPERFSIKMDVGPVEQVKKQTILQASTPKVNTYATLNREAKLTILENVIDEIPKKKLEKPAWIRNNKMLSSKKARSVFGLGQDLSIDLGIEISKKPKKTLKEISMLESKSNNGLVSLMETPKSVSKTSHINVKMPEVKKVKVSRASTSLQFSSKAKSSLLRLADMSKTKVSNKVVKKRRLHIGGISGFPSQILQRKVLKSQQKPISTYKYNTYSSYNLGNTTKTQPDSKHGMFGRTDNQQKTFQKYFNKNDSIIGVIQSNSIDMKKVSRHDSLYNTLQSRRVGLNQNPMIDQESFREVLSTQDQFRKVQQKKLTQQKRLQMQQLQMNQVQSLNLAGVSNISKRVNVSIPKMPKPRVPKPRVPKPKSPKLPFIELKQKVKKKKKKSRKKYIKKEFGVLELLKVKKSSGSVLNFM